MRARHMAVAPLIETTPATQVSIKNQLSTAVDIYDEFNPSTSTQQSPIKYTKLATIPAGGTASVEMIHEVALIVAAISGPIQELSGNYYDQLPIKSMSGTQVTFGDPPPLAYTITAADRTAAIRSFQFQKFMSANPDSALTKNFNTALKAGFAAVNTFFQGTDNYKACTMASWHIVMTWLQNATSGWQGPYFLYESPSPMPQDYVPQLIATVDIQSDAQNNSAVLTMCGADASGNPVFADPREQLTLTMAGDGTMQGTDENSGIAATLTPVWMNVIQTPLDASGTPVPKYLIGSALTGTVVGKQVVSSQTARQIPGKPAPPDAAEKESAFDKLFNKLVEIVGGLAGLVAIYEFLNKKKEGADEEKEAAKKKAKSAEDLEKQEKAIDDKTQAELSDPKSGLPAIEEKTAGTAQKVSDGYTDTVTEMKKATVTKAIEDNLANVENQVQEDIANGTPPSDAFEKAWTDAQKSAQNALDKVNDGDFESWKADLDQSLGNLTTEASTASAEIQTAVDNLRTDVQEANDRSAAADEAVEAHDKTVQDEDNDSGADPEDINDPPETDEVPIEGK